MLENGFVQRNDIVLHPSIAYCNVLVQMQMDQAAIAIAVAKQTQYPRMRPIALGRAELELHVQSGGDGTLPIASTDQQVEVAFPSQHARKATARLPVAVRNATSLEGFDNPTHLR